MKPRDNWDHEDWLDYLDGWHEASDLGFKTDRDLNRGVEWRDPSWQGHQLAAPLRKSTARWVYEQGKADQAKVAA